MNQAEILESLLGLFSALAVLWIFFFFFYRDYRIDDFRQRLFGLRDQLFYDAADGLIAFDHPAYGLLRGTMNGLVRFAHRLSFFEAILLLIMMGGAKGEFAQNFSFEKRFSESLEGVKPNTREKLVYYHRQMHKLMLIHMLKSSPFFICLVIIPLVAMVIPVIFFFVCRAFVVRKVYQVMSDPLGRIESAAMAYGC